MADSSGSSFAASSPLGAEAVSAAEPLGADFPAHGFVSPSDRYSEDITRGGTSSFGKRPVSRALFDDDRKRMYACGDYLYNCIFGYIHMFCIGRYMRAVFFG